MKTWILCLGVLLVGGVPAGSAQSPLVPPPDDTRTPIRPGSRAGEYQVIVEGCVQGTRLKPLVGVTDEAATYLNASEWMLEGPREVIQLVRSSLDRYHIEVTGLAILPRSLEPRDAEVESRRLPDGTRVTVGARRSTTERVVSPAGTDARPVRIDVKSVRVLAERCG